MKKTLILAVCMIVIMTAYAQVDYESQLESLFPGYDFTVGQGLDLTVDGSLLIMRADQGSFTIDMSTLLDDSLQPENIIVALDLNSAEGYPKVTFSTTKDSYTVEETADIDILIRYGNDPLAERPEAYFLQVQSGGASRLTMISNTDDMLFSSNGLTTKGTMINVRDFLASDTIKVLSTKQLSPVQNISDLKMGPLFTGASYPTTFDYSGTFVDFLPP